MTHLSHLASIVLMTLLCASAELSFAQESRPEARPLSTDQLSSIRVISRNILAAKKSGIDDSADVEQLKNFRTTLDKLIAAELDPKNRLPIALRGQDNGERRRRHDEAETLRKAARSDANKLTASMRQHSQRKMLQTREQEGDQTASSGLPVGEQRAMLFERWVQKLETALSDNTGDRAGQLLALQKQLGSTFGKVNAIPTARSTPTLQAMPSISIAPNQ
jgi:hypothetical protein